MDAVKPAAIPASETTTAPSTKAPDLPEDSTVASSTIPGENIPRVPPTPDVSTASAAAAAATVASAAPKKKGFFRRLRNYLLTLSILGALAFGGGVWYSRINDNFHDFFIQYIPYGEHAVLYLEEMEFRKRFPQVAQRVTGRQRDAGEQVKISAQSGASWRVADTAEVADKQPATRKTTAAKKAAAAKAKEEPKTEPQKVAEVSKPSTSSQTAAAPAVAPVVVAATPAPASSRSTDAAPDKPAFKAPEVDEPSRFPPASPIDPLAVNGAKEPVIQDLVHMLNDIISVVNADGANERYGATIGKAKNELNKVSRKIDAIKAAVEKEAAGKVKARVADFDKAANQLVERVENAMAAQETQWRREFEEETNRLKGSYDEKLRLVVEREKQLGEERLNNRLLEQAVELQRQFAQEVKKMVEVERDGRLGKLNDLSSAVSQLEKLTTGWNDVVDTNLRTQQLHVAVEAVRASLEDSQHPRPFIKELVALKEIAADDTVVDAAIASINPSAYQRGISTSAELIDRFRRVAGEVRKASLLPEDAGVASHASSWALSKLMFKKQGLAAGDDVESILTRTQTYLEEGDLDNAAREMNGLTGWAKTLSRDWLGEVRKVLEVQQALEVCSISIPFCDNHTCSY